MVLLTSHISLHTSCAHILLCFALLVTPFWTAEIAMRQFYYYFLDDIDIYMKPLAVPAVVD